MMVYALGSYRSLYSAMARGSTYGSSSRIPSIDRVSKVFDYKAEQAKVKDLYENLKSQTGKAAGLRQDSAEYLTEYTRDMKELGQSAKEIRGENLDKLLYEEDGKVTDKSLQSVSKAVETMVDRYNATLDTLRTNAGRGSGTARQLAQMQKSPGAAASMKMAGLSAGSDGKLALDSQKLTSAFKEASSVFEKTGNSSRLDMLKSVIGGSYGVAANVENKAQHGASASADALVSNDLVKAAQENMFHTMNSMNMYSRRGSYNMMNVGMTGMLMNLLA